MRASGGTQRSWRAAQRYELDWWERHGPAQLPALDARFARGAASLAALLDGQATRDWRRRALQVGTAGVAEIHHLPVRERWAVEPLAPALASRGLLVRGDVRWVCAVGERLPLPDGCLSLVLLPNVIDHVADPARVLSEARRCLEPGGLLWLSCHVSPEWTLPLFAALRRARVGYFVGHPWSFSAARLRALAEGCGMRVRLEWEDETESNDPPKSLRAGAKRRLLRVGYLLLDKPERAVSAQGCA